MENYEKCLSETKRWEEDTDSDMDRLAELEYEEYLNHCYCGEEFLDCGPELPKALRFTYPEDS